MISLTIYGFVRKRRDLATECACLEKRISEIDAELKAVDHILLLVGFVGNPADLRARQKHNRVFRRGELRKLILGALRDASGP
ncbi:hypothetical protein [Jiella marina]|uniref:hypothetical protein n=1 Tax=Jiella sp. LLJ827 TaxID=2917712 RepID=UPI00210069D2|nr:hypothetical protein [Jiella sp. LLJ827]MCQ0989477.1 hypothetical protein [Jiella sp. LLJ827]